MATKILPPFDAYDGDEPYVFVSYSHNDSDVIFKEIKRLHDVGCRIWYDDGIIATSEWSSVIEKKLKGCSLFLVYITARSRESENVKDEINYAIKKNKTFLYVCLEDVELPEGMGLRMDRLQGILKYQLDEETYLKKLLRGIPNSLMEPEKELGSLEIRCEMDGILWIDNKEIKSVAAATIVSVERLQVGEHQIMISSKDGEFRQSASIEDGKTTQISARMKRPVEVGIIWIPVEGFPKPFSIAATPVTFEQYDKFCDATGYRKPHAKSGRGKHPVTDVNVADAVAFCTWLSRETGTTVRLPSKAEWEFAARGGRKSKKFAYSGSNEIDEVAWYEGNSGRQSQVVGGKKPNELGIYDMSGNVAEWCGTSGILQGGSFYDSASNCRVDSSLDINPASRDSSNGFRCVRMESTAEKVNNGSFPEGSSIEVTLRNGEVLKDVQMTCGPRGGSVYDTSLQFTNDLDVIMKAEYGPYSGRFISLSRIAAIEFLRFNDEEKEVITANSPYRYWVRKANIELCGGDRMEGVYILDICYLTTPDEKIELSKIDVDIMRFVRA